MEDNIQEMYKKARKAFETVEYWPQEKVDEMVLAVGYEWSKESTAKELARLAVDESGIGVYEDKVGKIQSKTKGSLWDMRNAKTCGIVEELPEIGIVKFAKPIGVIAIQSYNIAGAYDVSHEEVLVTIASQAAVAIQNARLYEGTDEALARRVQEMASILRTTSEGIMVTDLFKIRNHIQKNNS